jgi:DNA-binding NarL/FixJ family response regulator
LRCEDGRVPIRVLLVEDDSFTRITVGAALKQLGFELVGSAAGIEEAMKVLHNEQIDCLVTDLDLGPGPTGIDLAFGARKAQPEIGIVLLTSFSDPRLLTSSLDRLPEGSTYVVKQSLTSIELLGASVEGASTKSGNDVPLPVLDLTDSQIETLRLLAYGLSNAEIARVRVVTEKAVEQAVARAAKRLGLDAQSGVNQRVALAREYFRLTGANRHTHAHR